MNDVELLRDGLAKIEAGWTQGELRKVDPENGILCHCALGAMGVEKFGVDEYGKLNQKLVKATELLLPALPDDAKSDEPGFCDIWRFNDRGTTKVDDVKAMFHRAIAIAEAKP